MYLRIRNIQNVLKQAAAAGLLFLSAAGQAHSAHTVSAGPMQYHKVEITFDGPALAEEDATFMNYRLNVLFRSPAGAFVRVPGFYAADGDAANSGATGGTKWRVRFCPEETGTYRFTASFRTGTDVAVSLEDNAGAPAAFDGETGEFFAAQTDKSPSGRDFRGKGILKYVKKRFLQWSGTGKYWIKAGTDSPETFLGYSEFDNTLNARVQYENHVNDWNAGDPVWKGGQGKGIIGAVNYMSSIGVNSQYMVAWNRPWGDGQCTYVWVDGDTPGWFTFDVSKLEQWEIVFSHMDKMGVAQHFLFGENENQNRFEDQADGFSDRRRVYYRELIARFSHHNGLYWNLGEETWYDNPELAQYAAYIRALDPYNRIIVMHDQNIGAMGPKMKDNCMLHGPSLYNNGALGETYGKVKQMVDLTKVHEWVVMVDETKNGTGNAKTDADDFWHDGARKEVVWASVMAGGAGWEHYFGFGYSCDDISCDDYTNREHLWQLSAYAHDFFQNYTEFWNMSNADNLVNNGWCLAKAGDVYAVYLKTGGSVSLDLSGVSGTFEIGWFNARDGGALQNGSVSTVEGGGSRSLGSPIGSGDDWAVRVIRQGYTIPSSPAIGTDDCDGEIPIDTSDIPVDPADTTCGGKENVIFEDCFNREDGAVIANGWAENESAGNSLDIFSGAVQVTSDGSGALPLFSHDFSTSTDRIRLQFEMDWTRTGMDDDYMVLMQAGSSALMNEDDLQAGVAVSLIWAGSNNGMTDHQHFGYMDSDGNVQDIIEAAGKTRVKVDIETDIKFLNLYVDGTMRASGFAYRDAAVTTVDRIRFLTVGVNTADFAGKTFDSVELIDDNPGSSTVFSGFLRKNGIQILPFLNRGTIGIGLEKEASVSVNIFAQDGKFLAELYGGRLPAGKSDMDIGNRSLGRGVYLVEVRVGSLREVVRAVKY